MKVLLIQDVAGIGKKGDVKSVADGYAQNFLIPNKFALVYDDATKFLIEKNEKIQHKVEKQTSALSEKISSLVLEFPVQSHDDGVLYGSIKSQDIVKKIMAEHRIVLHPGQICLEKPLKKVGSYLLQVKLSNKLHAKLKLRLVAV
jgi:large subunit ribosomal protein L9